MAKTILYIHQSSELYGSDKALLYLVKSIESSPEFKTIVVLPNKGPLKDLLEAFGVNVIVFPVIKISRSIFKPLKLLSLPFEIAKTTKRLHRLLKNENIDLIHSNTLAVLLGGFYAKRYKVKHLWHVHEIIKKPKIVSKIYPFLVNSLSDTVVFNSEASKEVLCKNNQKLTKKAIVNLNGMDREKPPTSDKDIKAIRRELFGVNDNEKVIALIGRISKWKGQTLLLEAFKKASPENKNAKLIFVGSAPPNQEYLVEELQQNITQASLENLCSIIPFQENIWSIWDSIDIAVVPSIEPEPFGLVALEAMLSRKPVIAANHGGLKEIVLDGETGYFFNPGDVDDLSKKLKLMLTNEEKSIDFGKKGYEHAKQKFSLDRHVSQFIDIYKKN
ncbi:glycosyltransferase family 4 protein [Psychroserpens sp. XS_ASV72]|uniref:glycosyltransferase family 4 protein n=1 Tax=Psychroserpens sp. XS_ASV72 TaxID=3241293 RepID=UPI0035168847